MSNRIPYLLIVGAKPTDSENYAFQVSGPYTRIVTGDLSVVDCSYLEGDSTKPTDYGMLSITFNQIPTFNPDGGPNPPGIDGCANNTNQHGQPSAGALGPDPVDGYVNLGYITGVPIGLSLSGTHDHGVSTGITLVYNVTLPNPSSIRLTFTPGLANSNGVPVRNASGVNAPLRITVTNEGTVDNPNWVAHWSKEFGGDL